MGYFSGGENPPGGKAHYVRCKSLPTGTRKLLHIIDPYKVVSPTGNTKPTKTDADYSGWRPATDTHDAIVVHGAMPDSGKVNSPIVWWRPKLFSGLYASIAQLGERGIRNAKVKGSIPFGSSINRQPSIDRA